PSGRPKNHTSLTDLLRKEIRKICPEDRLGRSYLELIVQATMRLAIKGNATALTLVWDRLDGKVPPVQEPETGKDIRIRVVYEDTPLPNANLLASNPDHPEEE